MWGWARAAVSWAKVAHGEKKRRDGLRGEKPDWAKWDYDNYLLEFWENFQRF